MQLSEMPKKVQNLLLKEIKVLNSINEKTDLSEYNWDKFSQGYAFWFKVNQGIFEDVPEIEIVPEMSKPDGQEKFKAKPLQSKSSDLVSIIKNNDVINVSGLERTLSIPKGAISKAMNGSRLIPEKYIFIISKYLSKF